MGIRGCPFFLLSAPIAQIGGFGRGNVDVEHLAPLHWMISPSCFRMINTIFTSVITNSEV